jgi:hypothetical protein
VTVAADIILGNGGVNTTAENVYTYRVTPNTGTPTVPVMVVRLRPSQTSNIQEWQDSSSNILTRIDYLGNVIAPARVYVGVGATGIASTKLSVVIDNAAFVGQVIRAAASQTADLQQWQNSAGTVMSKIDSAGNITPGTPTVATPVSSAGYLGMPQISTATSYTLTAADVGKHVYTTVTGQTITIPANASVALPIGTTYTFINPASVSTTIAITTDTMYLAGTGTTGSRTLAAFGMATAVKVTSTTWVISGNGLT